MADEPEPPADAGTGRARTHPVVWIVVIASVLASAGVISLADRTPTDDARNAAESFLPPDGAVRVITYADGSEWIVETARDTGVAYLVQQPPLSGEHQLTRIGSLGQDVAQSRFFRQTWTDVAGERDQVTELYELDSDGFRLLTLTGGTNGFSYEPGLLVLPSTVAAGSTWSSEGAALPQNLITYTSTGAARAGDDGCLIVDVDVTYTDPAQADAVLLESTETSTWCPGEGQVATTFANNGEEGSARSAPFESRSIDAVNTPFEVDLTGAENWTATSVPLTLRDPVFGETSITGATDGLAAVTTSGVSVYNTGTDLVGYALGEGEQVRDWIAHPGGEVTRLTAIGDIVVVATTDRTLVAYDDHGRRGWSLTFDDVVLTTPISDGTGGLLVLSLDGELRRVDLTTGDVRWSTWVGGDSDISPVAVDGLVVTADRSGTVRAFSLDTGAPVWSAPMEKPARLAADDTRVFAVADDGVLFAWEAATGLPAWENTVPGTVSELLPFRGGVAAQSQEGTFVFDEAGVDLWFNPASIGMITDGARLVVGGLDTAFLLDGNGETLASWPVMVDVLSASRYVRPAPNGFWVVNSNFEVVGVSG